ncbi:MAG: helix-turn-helix transcriptional regulator [Desulfobacteraceae bacterium]
MISNKSGKGLTQLGEQLRKLRLERNDRQSDFAARLGVSIPTLRKLEQGDPTVAIGTWIDAIWLVGRLDELTKVLEPTPSLFDQWERQRQTKTRKRASKK